jgi:hypothetical protein
MTLIAIMGIQDHEEPEARTNIENLQAGEINCHLVSIDPIESCKLFAKKVSIIQDKINPYKCINASSVVIAGFSSVMDVNAENEVLYNTVCLTAAQFKKKYQDESGEWNALIKNRDPQ